MTTQDSNWLKGRLSKNAMVERVTLGMGLIIGSTVTGINFHRAGFLVVLIIDLIGVGFIIVPLLVLLNRKLKNARK